MTKITIHITKEVLEASKYCGKQGGSHQVARIGQNCAIGKAIHNLFPNSWVNNARIRVANTPIEFDEDGWISAEWTRKCIFIDLPEKAQVFIIEFDIMDPNSRTQMPELSFDIEIPDSVLEFIPIDDVYRILSESKTMSLA